MDEFVEVIREIGTGICPESKFEELLDDAKECQEMKRKEFALRDGDGEVSYKN